MIAAGNMWRTDRSQLIALVGAGVAVAALVLNAGFFFRPGTSEVLGGLAHHAFVLGWLLILTSGSRTVSLGTLAAFWLLGLWAVTGVAYLLEDQLASLFGAEVDGQFVPVWLAPFVEETTRLLPVAVFFLLAGRGGRRQPAMSDGLLLGFMVGAGVSFHEDANIGKIILSGDGWGAASPWSALFPTISHLKTYFALNNALWSGLGGLSLGAAVMLRHWRWTWPIALVGLALALTNHVMSNHFASNVFQALGRAKVPWFYDKVRDLTASGRLPMQVLIVAAVAVVAGEWLILRWVAKRDRRFPPLPFSRLSQIVGRSTSWPGIATLLAADRYLRLRRSVYFAAWRTRRAGGYPDVSDADYAQLVTLAARFEMLQPAPLSGDAAQALVPPAADAAPPEAVVVPTSIPAAAAAGAAGCPSCGVVNAPGARFCTSCGTQLASPPGAASVQVARCRNCAAELAPGVRFCVSCGTPAT